MMKVKVTQIGNSVGMVLPREALKKLNVSRGNELYLVETPEGLMLTPYDQTFEAQMEAAKKVMKRYRNTLHRLAK